jgi:hypothetical protein
MRLIYISLVSFIPLFMSADPADCTKINDNEKRLQCYDSFFLKDTAETPQVVISDGQEDPAVTQIEKELKIKEAKLLAKEKELQRKEKELISDQERRWFGFSRKPKEDSDTEELKIFSKIDTVATKLNYQLLIILENGQHWVSVEKFRRHKLKDGYEVEISEGFLSGFALRVPDTKIKIRVRRIK